VFTGIVEELGAVVERDAERLRIGCATVLDDVVLGASIAVNGCCLTVIRWTEGASDGWWEAELTDETWSRTSLGDLRPGDPVNLERPVRLSDRLGGHLVQGHVDGVGEIVTVVAALDDGFTVAIIPHTHKHTTLGTKRAGDRVNLEVDVTAKYVERLLAWRLDPAAPAPER